MTESCYVAAASLFRWGLWIFIDLTLANAIVKPDRTPLQEVIAANGHSRNHEQQAKYWTLAFASQGRRRQFAKQLFVVQRKLAQVPKAPVRGNVLYGFVRPRIPQRAAHSIQA